MRYPLLVHTCILIFKKFSLFYDCHSYPRCRTTSDLFFDIRTRCHTGSSVICFDDRLNPICIVIKVRLDDRYIRYSIVKSYAWLRWFRRKFPNIEEANSRILDVVLAFTNINKFQYFLFCLSYILCIILT